MKAYLKTKSNFKNSNGIALDIVEISVKRVTCLVPFHGFDRQGTPLGIVVKADFHLNEVESFTHHVFDDAEIECAKINR